MILLIIPHKQKTKRISLWKEETDILYFMRIFCLCEFVQTYYYSTRLHPTPFYPIHLLVFTRGRAIRQLFWHASLPLSLELFMYWLDWTKQLSNYSATVLSLLNANESTPSCLASFKITTGFKLQLMIHDFYLDITAL